MLYLRLLSCCVNLLISMPESLREDRVPGTSCDATFNKLSIDDPSFLNACTMYMQKLGVGSKKVHCNIISSLLNYLK